MFSFFVPKQENMEEKKEENEIDSDITVKATMTITKGYKLPLAKLTVSGSINNESEDNANRIVQRAIIFVIDRSGSMVFSSYKYILGKTLKPFLYQKGGSRMNMVKDTLQTFIAQICDDPNTIIRLVLFNGNVEIVNIPKDKTKAESLINSKVYASGGTDFHSAAIGLVQEAKSILTHHPNHQVLNE